MSEHTPWRKMLAQAVLMGMAPREFWRLSLAEWRALVAPIEGSALRRAEFDALTRLYPDHSNG